MSFGYDISSALALFKFRLILGRVKKYVFWWNVPSIGIGLSSLMKDRGLRKDNKAHKQAENYGPILLFKKSVLVTDVVALVACLSVVGWTPRLLKDTL